MIATRFPAITVRWPVEGQTREVRSDRVVDDSMPRTMCGLFRRVVAAAAMGKQVIGAGDGRPSPFAPFGTLSEQPCASSGCITALHRTNSSKMFAKSHAKKGAASQTEASSLISGGVCRNTKSIGSRAGGFRSLHILPEVKGGFCKVIIESLGYSLARLPFKCRSELDVLERFQPADAPRRVGAAPGLGRPVVQRVGRRE